MPLTTSSIVTNMLSMNSARQLGIVTDRKAKSTEKLSSGYKINRAADDAANLAISEKMRRQIRGLNQGSNNIQEGISLCRVADGALAEIHDMLHRGTELSVKAANGTLSEQDREFLDDEVNQLLDEMEQTVERVTFNGISVLKAGIGYGNYKHDGWASPASQNTDSDEEYARKLYMLTMGGEVDKSPAWVTQSNNGKTFDFSDFSEENNKQSLLNTAISFSGVHTGDQSYTIFFNDTHNKKTDAFVTEDGILYDMRHTIIDVNISNIRTGEELIEEIHKVAGDTFKQPGSVSFGYSGSTLTNNGAGGSARGGHFYGAEMDDAGLYDIRIQAGPEIGDCIDFRLPDMQGVLLLRDYIDIKNGPTTWRHDDRQIPLSNMDAFKAMSGYVSRERSRIGAVQNRLEHSYLNNLNTAENTTAAESQIRDTDMAREMVANAKENILQQAGQTVLAQANQSRQGLLNLLG